MGIETIPLDRIFLAWMERLEGCIGHSRQLVRHHYWLLTGGS
jgi:hypothetical protein